MKKLNRKGFTLIELLAVIVILAIVMVVTIPSVLNSMESARQKQFENAIHSIEEYVQKNYDLCKLGAGLTGDNNYDASVFGSSTDCTPDNTAVIEAAGYSLDDIATVTGSVNANGKYIITSATVGANTQFKGATYGTAPTTNP